MTCYTTQTRLENVNVFKACFIIEYRKLYYISAALYKDA